MRELRCKGSRDHQLLPHLQGCQRPAPEVPTGPLPTTPEPGRISTLDVPGPPPPPEQPRRSNRNGIIIGIVVILLVLILARLCSTGGKEEKGEALPPKGPSEQPQRLRRKRPWRLRLKLPTPNPLLPKRPRLLPPNPLHQSRNHLPTLTPTRHPTSALLRYSSPSRNPSRQRRVSRTGWTARPACVTSQLCPAAKGMLTRME